MRFMLKITEIMKNLAKDRPIFHSEADFQFALAWEIQKAMPDCQIRLEYPFSDGKERKYLDIWLQGQDTKIAIELKYRTQQLDRVINGESFVLKPHSALDTGRYGFIRDVRRLEQIRERKLSDIGFAVLLTNDPLFWDSPKNKTQDEDFLIYDGREEIKGEMKWSEVKEWMKTDGVDKPIKLGGCYKLNWEDYSDVCGKEKYSQFRYLVVKVPCSAA